MNEEKIFDIEAEWEGTFYRGWVNPSDKINDDGLPSSYHVVLNDVSFGYLSFSNGKWSADEQRPAGLVQEVAKQINERYHIISQNRLNA